MRMNTLASSCKPKLSSSQSLPHCHSESHSPLIWQHLPPTVCLTRAGHIQRIVESKWLVLCSCPFILPSILRSHALLNFLFFVCESTSFLAVYPLFFRIAAKQQAFAAFRLIVRYLNYTVAYNNIDSNNVKVSRQMRDVVLGILFRQCA